MGAEKYLGGVRGNFGYALRGAAANAITQGIGVATGMQREFSWAGVAAAGAGAWAGARFGGGNRYAAIAASTIADAATRSLIEGSDFGDNIIAALPNAIGQMFWNWATSPREEALEAPAVQERETLDNELPSDVPFTVDANGRVLDADAARARLADFQHGPLNLRQTEDGYTTTATPTAFDENGGLYHPEGAGRVVFDYVMDDSRPLAGIWVALPESKQVVSLITDGEGLYVYGGLGDARISGLGLSIRATQVLDDIVVTAQLTPEQAAVHYRATHPTYGEQYQAIRAAHPEINDGAMLRAIGRGYGEAAIGGYQGMVQGGYDFGLMAFDASVGIRLPGGGRLSDIFARDLFGAPTSSWQGAGRVVGEIAGVPLPANGARVLAMNGARALRHVPRGSFPRSVPRVGMASAPGEFVSINGVQAFEIGSRRVSPGEMATMQARFGTEFAQVYIKGPGRNGGGGTYYLIQGSQGTVPIPIRDDLIWISHTHPAELDGVAITLVASGKDRNVLARLQAVGSPQRTSQVIPEVGEPFFFTKSQSRLP